MTITFSNFKFEKSEYSESCKVSEITFSSKNHSVLIDYDEIEMLDYMFKNVDWDGNPGDLIVDDLGNCLKLFSEVSNDAILIDYDEVDGFINALYEFFESEK